MVNDCTASFLLSFFPFKYTILENRTNTTKTMFQMHCKKTANPYKMIPVKTSHKAKYTTNKKTTTSPITNNQKLEPTPN